MTSSRTLALCAAIAASTASAASAESYTFDISGLSTFTDSFDDAFPTLTHDFGVEGTVVGVEFDVNYESFDPSWVSEVLIAVDTDDDLSLDADLDMFDYGAPDSPGTFAASGSIAANSFSSNGVVYLTLYEFFDDGSVDPDATFGAGSLVTVLFTPTAVAIPEPSSIALCGLGLAGGLAAGLRRRRRPSR
ncbi:PEP-CTERM sorting domain-containing protein [Tautonia plasticadhaerens]|uniref:PEP-CTERM motif protein n=1 Tax=Tautonia plasticadhaerens TaxID=2527974 RepID=A0A518HCG0_9BACT|nr:PEP-CTERM sorting domain-containing protein [Tautonia plasticadhaerens]QDV38539.1 PEP-CTERM motif protein [Tautonia plasticadhaerens]